MAVMLHQMVILYVATMMTEDSEDMRNRLTGEFNCVLGRNELAGGCAGSINTEALNQNRTVMRTIDASSSRPRRRVIANFHLVNLEHLVPAGER